MVRPGALPGQLVGTCLQSMRREEVIVEPEFADLLPAQRSFEVISTEKLIAITESYIVETPASIADDKVNATDRNQFRTRLNDQKACVQH